MRVAALLNLLTTIGYKNYTTSTKLTYQNTWTSIHCSGTSSQLNFNIPEVHSESQKVIFRHEDKTLLRVLYHSLISGSETADSAL